MLHRIGSRVRDSAYEFYARARPKVVKNKDLTSARIARVIGKRDTNGKRTSHLSKSKATRMWQKPDTVATITSGLVETDYIRATAESRRSTRVGSSQSSRKSRRRK